MKRLVEQQARELKDHNHAAARGHELADVLDQDAKEPSRADFDQARAWSLVNASNYDDKTAAEKHRVDREIVQRWHVPGDPEKARRPASFVTAPNNETCWGRRPPPQGLRTTKPAAWKLTPQGCVQQMHPNGHRRQAI